MVQETNRFPCEVHKFDQQLQITGVIVTYNEDLHLYDCLNSISFCDQLIVVDLGSNDNSVKVANQFGAEVIFRKRVPVVEMVLPEVMALANNEWIIRADPDEIYPYELAYDLLNAILDSDSTAIINIPYQYYFLGKPIKTTRWGGIKYIGKVFHRNRVHLKALVHRGIHCKDGFVVKNIVEREVNVVRHYWVNTIGQLFEKHLRYIKIEGESRYHSGERFSLFGWVREILAALKANLLNYKGINGGWLGIFLSFFYSWYVGMSLLSLRRYQKYVEDTSGKQIV